jgi:zinc/manganese transport system substrate-binding protein
MAPRPRTATFAGIGVAALLVSGCADGGGDAGDGASAPSVSVVATTTVWGDIARQIVECADDGRVTTLIPLGADPHDFSASSEDVAAMEAADLVIANGLGLEEGLAAALDAARADGANVVEIAPKLDPIPFGAQGGHAEDGETHSDDPHVWLDIARGATAAGIIGDLLTDATGNPRLSECGRTLQDELDALDAQVVDTLAVVPEEARVLVTDHDAFGYFAQAYDFEVAGTVIPGGSTLAQPSSAEMAALVEAIERTGVPAIFANLANPAALVDALAREVGDVEVVSLYVGSLGEPGSGAETYQGMMAIDAQRIADALAG